MPGCTVRLTGWGRISPSSAELAEPATPADAAGTLGAAAKAYSGVIPRGLGRRYNNAAQRDGGLVISTARLNRVIDLDAATGLPCRPPWPRTATDRTALASHDRRFGYLAKDSRVPPDVLAGMYQRLPEFRKLRAELDPAGILASDLSRRPGL